MAKEAVATDRIATSARAGTRAAHDPHAAVAAGALCDPPTARATDTRLPLPGAVIANRPYSRSVIARSTASGRGDVRDGSFITQGS
jgi:hypothetical protein